MASHSTNGSALVDQAYLRYLHGNLLSELDKHYDTRLANMATTVQHNTRGLLSLQAKVKDNKWQRTKALNLKVIPLDGCAPQYKLPRDLSEGIRAQRIQAMCGFVERTTKFTPVLPG